MTDMFGEAWSPMSVPDLAPDDDDDSNTTFKENFYAAPINIPEVSHVR